MKKILFLIIAILMFGFPKPTLANTWLAGPLIKLTETDNLKCYLEYSYESYDLENGSGYTCGVIYKILDLVTIEGSLTLNKEAKKVYYDESLSEELSSVFNSIHPEVYSNFSISMGDINRVMFLAQYTFEDETRKLGVFHSFQLPEADNLFLIGGGTLTAKKLAADFETSPFIIIEFKNNLTYCRLQYVSGISPEYIQSGETTLGQKEINWILSIGYTF